MKMKMRQERRYIRTRSRVFRSNRFLDRYRRNRFMFAKNPSTTFSVCTLESRTFRRVGFEKHMRTNEPKSPKSDFLTTTDDCVLDGRERGRGRNENTITPCSHSRCGFYQGGANSTISYNCSYSCILNLYTILIHKIGFRYR